VRARWLACALGVAALAFVAHRALVPLAEHDLFFHLKLGDLILARRAIPFRNLFSFTYPDHPDSDLAWAFQVLVSLLYRAGGFSAIVATKAGLCVAAVALAWRACRRAGVSPAEAACAAILCTLAAEPRMVERPHLVTFVGLGITQLVLDRLARADWRPLVWFPPVVAVWANFHAGVFFAPLCCALAGIGAAIDQRRGDRCAPALHFTIAALAAAASFASPGGTRLLSYLGWHTGLSATRNIDEFRRADPFNDPWFFAMIALVALALLARGRRVRLRQALPVLVIGLLAARSVRFVAEWALFAAPLCAGGVANVLGLLRPRAQRVVELGLLLTIVWSVAAGRVGARNRLGLADDVAPFAAIDFVTQHGLRERMYHDLDLGCYLLWQGWPRFSVFQDARLPAYPDEFHRALDQTPLAPAPWDALLRRYGVDAALLTDPGINARAGSFDPDEWALVWRSDAALVFARRVPRHGEVIAERELPLRVRFAMDRGSWVEPIPHPPARSPVAGCEWDRRLADALDALARPEDALDARADAVAAGCLPPDAEAGVRFRLGARLQREGRLSPAAAEYDRALALLPSHVDALVNRGFARLDADPDSARADFLRALTLEPARVDARLGLGRLGDYSSLTPGRGGSVQSINR
jgi:tetratricopeptide (TPR) repeat protein